MSLYFCGDRPLACTAAPILLIISFCTSALVGPSAPESFGVYSPLIF